MHISELPESLKDPRLATVAERTCGHAAGNKIYLTLVPSAPHHRDKRKAIRNSWGARANVVFIVGSSTTENFSALTKEAETHGDVLIANDTQDGYKSLSAKTVFGLRWIKNYCRLPPGNTRHLLSPTAGYAESQTKINFVLKVDDDSFINVMRLERFLAELLTTYSVDETGKRLRTMDRSMVDFPCPHFVHSFEPRPTD